MEHKKTLKRALSSTLALCMVLCSMQLMAVNAMAAACYTYTQLLTAEDVDSMPTVNCSRETISYSLNAEIEAGTFMYGTKAQKVQVICSAPGTNGDGSADFLVYEYNSTSGNYDSKGSGTFSYNGIKNNMSESSLWFYVTEIPITEQNYKYKEIHNQDDINNIPYLDANPNDILSDINTKIAAGEIFADPSITGGCVITYLKDPTVSDNSANVLLFARNSAGQMVYNRFVSVYNYGLITALDVGPTYYPTFELGAEIVAGNDGEEYLIISVPEDKVDEYTEIGIKAGKSTAWNRYPSHIVDNAIVDKTKTVYDTISDGDVPVTSTLSGKLFAFKVTGYTTPGAMLTMFGYGVKTDGTIDMSPYVGVQLS